MLRGLDVVDKRSKPARIFTQTRADIIAQLGGNDAITPTQRGLVDITCRGLLYLAHLDAVLLERKTILNRKGTRLVPLVHDRRILADSVTKQLAMLGFTRVTRVRSLAQELLQ